MSSVAVFRAALAADWQQILSAGEEGVVLLLGADKKQARILRQYCAGLLRAPMLAEMVTRTTAERIEFSNGAALEIATNDADLIRGRSAIAVLGTECCFWRTDEQSTSSDEEVETRQLMPILILAERLHTNLCHARQIARRHAARAASFIQTQSLESDSRCHFVPVSRFTALAQRRHLKAGIRSAPTA